MATHSVRSLATLLNLSRTTISLALRGSSKVKESTRRMVIEKAEQLGYSLDPVASELMMRMRRSESLVFRGLIVCILPEHSHAFSSMLPGQEALIQAAARKRATELGFELDFLKLSRDAKFWIRLPKVLHARGAVGLLLFPSDGCQALNRALIGKEKYPIVQLDAPEEGAEHVDVVAPDYQHASFIVFRQLAGLGYRRPGLILHGSPHASPNRCWLGAYAAMRQSLGGFASMPTPLLVENEDSSRMQIEKWVKDHEVDAVLGTGGISAKLGLPFYSLDILPNDNLSMGLDLRWSEIASRSIDIIVRKHFDRLCGRVESPALVSIPPLWRAAEAKSVIYRRKSYEPGCPLPDATDASSALK